MGMSTHIAAFRDMDGKFLKMLEAKQFCDSNGFSYPVEVQEYFGSEVANTSEYLTETFSEVSIEKLLRPWNRSHSEGYEIDVKDIPADVKTLRFYNSW